MLRIKDWDTKYENSRTRELKKLDWVPVPNTHDGYGFRTLMSMEDGTAIFGTWILMLEVASKCSPRGMLRKGTGLAHTAESLAVMTGASANQFTRAIEVLTDPEIGWIEDVDCEEGIIPFREPSDSKEKLRAHGRVSDALKRGKDVVTPEGNLSSRPSHCQWCGVAPPPDGKGNTRIVGHHLTGYGASANDLTVMFLCRKCHGAFENKTLTNHDVMVRFGNRWMSHRTATPPQGDNERTATPPQGATYERREGREGKGREGTALTPGSEDLPSPPPKNTQAVGATGMASEARTKPAVSASKANFNAGDQYRALLNRYPHDMGADVGCQWYLSEMGRSADPEALDRQMHAGLSRYLQSAKWRDRGTGEIDPQWVPPIWQFLGYPQANRPSSKMYLEHPPEWKPRSTPNKLPSTRIVNPDLSYLDDPSRDPKNWEPEVLNVKAS